MAVRVVTLRESVTDVMIVIARLRVVAMDRVVGIHLRVVARDRVIEIHRKVGVVTLRQGVEIAHPRKDDIFPRMGIDIAAVLHLGETIAMYLLRDQSESRSQGPLDRRGIPIGITPSLPGTGDRSSLLGTRTGDR